VSTDVSAVHTKALNLKRPFSIIGLLMLVAVPGVLLRFTGYAEDPLILAAIFGLAVLAAAFLLGAGAELAEIEISASLSLALVALVAVLPEYAVDMVFAWKAADDPIYAHYAAANMTGGNRLLIGIGWSMVILLFWWKQSRKPLRIDGGQLLELSFLLIATVWAFTIYIQSLFRQGSLNIVDTVVLVGLFVAYLIVSARGKAKEGGHMVGPMAPLGGMTRRGRRLTIIGLLVVSAFAILAVAEPFAESLIETGHHLGVDEFILVQWVAPLASEAPELLVAFMFAWRGMGNTAIGLLISSKVNQWTLLIGTLPIVYSINLGHIGELPLDGRQADEFLLTAAQSLFAVLLLASLRVSWRSGLVIFALFITQFFFTSEQGRIIFSVIYLALSIAVLLFMVQSRKGVWEMIKGVRHGFRFPEHIPDLHGPRS